MLAARMLADYDKNDNNANKQEEVGMREPNIEKLNALVGKLVGDLGISLGGASILLGDRLGLYKAMADGVPVTPAELAKKTGLHERYVREWLSGQAASGYIDYYSEKRNSRTIDLLAEGVGFEPTVPLQARRFSRPVP